MTPTPRARLDALLELYTGIEVARGGISANIDQYLTRRLPELGMTEVEDYLSRLGPTSAELERLLNAITVTHTWFMRDPGQLAIIEELLKESPSAGKMRRIWVPGCAVFGMPKAALESGAASVALDPVGIAREVTTWVSLQPEPRRR